MRTIKYILILGLLFTATVLIAASPDVHAIRASKLRQYDFVRGVEQFHDLELLLGNAEMGSTAKQNGLGFERLWFSDFWRTASARMPIYGPYLQIRGATTPDRYSQTLDLCGSVLRTEFRQGEVAYKSELFFSEADKDLLVMRLYDLSPEARQGITLHLPFWDVSATEGDRSQVVRSQDESVFRLEELSPNCVLGASIDSVMAFPKRMYKAAEPYETNHRMVYGVWSSAALSPCGAGGVYAVDTRGCDELMLVFSESTNWANGDLRENVLNQLRNKNNYELLKRSHLLARQANWERMAVIELPDPAHEQLWYRSLFWLFATTASRNCLPGESQFGFEGWNMLPFTYGSAGWGALDFAMLGDPEKALHILRQFDLPEAQHRNAVYWLHHAQREREQSGMTHRPPYPQDPDCPAARCFAHEMQTSGDCTLLTWGNQGHLQGFCVELFQRYYNYHPSEEFLCSYLYPVAKGIAEYWSNFLIWNHLTEEYYTAKTWGASEAGMHNNPLDAVMAAKKSLRAAAKYAGMLDIDAELAQKWRFIDEHLHYPRNESGYIAYIGHDGQVPEDGSGYNGIRYMNAANFINQELVDELNREQVVDLLERISKSNQFGKGFAVFHSAQTATAEALFGRGDSALGYLNGVLRALDSSGTSIRECEDRHMTYFLTNTDAYLLAPLFMLLQSSKGVIKPFPAMPATWEDVAFYDLPAEQGIKVSGKMEGGKVRWITYTKDGCVLRRTTSSAPVRIDELLKAMSK